MTKQDAARWLPLVQALAEGKTLQVTNLGDKWEDTAYLMPDHLGAERYRVKPEPRRWWANVKAKSSEIGLQGCLYTTKEAAMLAITGISPATQVEVVEVLP